MKPIAMKTATTKTAKRSIITITDLFLQCGEKSPFVSVSLFLLLLFRQTRPKHDPQTFSCPHTLRLKLHIHTVVTQVPKRDKKMTVVVVRKESVLRLSGISFVESLLV